ncbi:unknown [Coprobacillus sp. CAG:235]|nr:unknown [Coprobacillus sp. CAG:235]
MLSSNVVNLSLASCNNVASFVASSVKNAAGIPASFAATTSDDTLAK